MTKLFRKISSKKRTRCLHLPISKAPYLHMQLILGATCLLNAVGFNKHYALYFLCIENLKVDFSLQPDV